MIALLLDGPLAGQTQEVPDPPLREIEVPRTAEGTGIAAGQSFVKHRYRLTDEGGPDNPTYRYAGPLTG